MDIEIHTKNIRHNPSQFWYYPLFDGRYSEWEMI